MPARRIRLDAGKHSSFTMRGRTGGNMIRRLSCPMAVIMAVSAALLAAPAGAADLKVTSAGAVRGLIAQIIDDYSRQTGQKFDFTIGTTGQLRNIIASGQPADLDHRLGAADGRVGEDRQAHARQPRRPRPRRYRRRRPRRRGGARRLDIRGAAKAR